MSELETLREQVAKLQKFKDYVHARLDAAGVPVDPESSHKAEGCRIGGRLDVVFAQRDDMLAELRRLQKWFDAEYEMISETGTGSTEGELIDEAVRIKAVIAKSEGK